MRIKRGQAGIEYVILTGILLFFFIPLVHYSTQETTNAVRNSQLDSYVSRLSKAVNAVHSVGPGTMEIIIVTVPNGVTTADLINVPGGISEIVLQAQFFGGISDIHASVKPLIYGDIPNTPGTYHLRVKSMNESSINISWGG